MFQKFTERAIQAVKNAYGAAQEWNYGTVTPEHLFWALSKDKSELGSKLLKVYKISPEKIEEVLRARVNSVSGDAKVVFGDEIKSVFKSATETALLKGNGFVGTEHLFYALLVSDFKGFDELFEQLGLDKVKIKGIIEKLFVKPGTDVSAHPESEDSSGHDDSYERIFSAVNDPESESVFNRAVSKLTASGYEILGTEQIMQSVLEDGENEAVTVLNGFGINSSDFAKMLEKVTSRNAEYEDRQIIFTPNAMHAMLLASEAAKEQGCTTIKPEHIVLGILQSRKGIAYNIMCELCGDTTELIQKISKPAVGQLGETGLILKFAKQEAVRTERSYVGTESVLVGIMTESTGIGYRVLKELGVTVKDLREEIAKTLGEGDDYGEKEITFTPRAKLILEKAWEFAKKEKKTKIYSQHLLEAICDCPDCIASKVLSSLGVDALEIKQGIRNRTENY